MAFTDWRALGAFVAVAALCAALTLRNLRRSSMLRKPAAEARTCTTSSPLTNH
jgi:hypothetical protein